MIAPPLPCTCAEGRLSWSGTRRPDGLRASSSIRQTETRRSAYDLNTGIADENVDRAEALKGCSNANFDSRFIADIHCDCHGATAGAIDLVHGRLRRRQLQVRDHRAPPRKESQSNYRE